MYENMHNDVVRCVWHEAKRQGTPQTRGLDFADVEVVFAGPTLTFEGDRLDCGKQRFVTMGLLGRKAVVIVHTETEHEIRVISMREASKNEQRLFFRNIP